jgi:hypothetical protein
LTIIGVTDEPSAKIKTFIESKGIKYTIAIASKNENPYKSTGIPHAWLVDSKGQIVWKGHPQSLKEGELEESLKTADIPPAFNLPRELASAQKLLAERKYGAGIKALESHAARPKTPELGKAAKEALEQTTSYGKKKLQDAEESAKAGDYVRAHEILGDLEKSFKGSETGDKSKQILADWKADKDLKLELEAAQLVTKADTLIAEKQWPAAAACLQKATKKKFEGTKTRAIAEKRLAMVQKKL